MTKSFQCLTKVSKTISSPLENTSLSTAETIDTTQTSADSLTVLFQLVSYLLEYPGDTWEDDLSFCRHLLTSLPETAAASLRDFLDWADSREKIQIEQEYVQIFDQRRRCCLELSYYSTGDTRQRGIALSIFQDLYAAVGWEMNGKNLPDYLPYLLELAAITEGEDRDLVMGLLASHRDGIEVLAQALQSLSSPWAAVIAALQSVLPIPDPQVKEQIMDLIRTGPPSESVGRDTRGQDSNTVFLSSAAALVTTMTRNTKKMEKNQ